MVEQVALAIHISALMSCNGRMRCTETDFANRITDLFFISSTEPQRNSISVLHTPNAACNLGNVNSAKVPQSHGMAPIMHKRERYSYVNRCRAVFLNRKMSTRLQYVSSWIRLRSAMFLDHQIDFLRLRACRPSRKRPFIPGLEHVPQYRRTSMRNFFELACACLLVIP